MLGGDGKDTLLWRPSDTLDGGAGLDTLLYVDSGELDFDPRLVKSMAVINLGAFDNNGNGVALSLDDALAVGNGGTDLTCEWRRH